MSKLFQFDKPNFTNQFGTGTLSEQRSSPTQTKNKPDAAGIIDASANGLDSVTNFIGTIMNKPSTSPEQNYTAPPPQDQAKISPWAIGGIIAAVALITLLIVLNNGKAKPSTPK